MTPVRVDVAPPGAPGYAEAGLGRGWEPAALLGAVLILLSFGLVNLYSASAFLAQRQDLPDTFYVLRQTAGAAGGLLLMVVVSRIPHRWWRHLAWPLVVGTFGLLVTLVLPWTHGIAPEINGARRWLQVGIAVQPSEFAKLALIVWTAHIAVRKQGDFQSLSKGLGPFLLVWGAILLPVLLQPDFSTAVVIGVLAATVVFAAGARIGHFVFLGLVCSPIILGQLANGFRQARMDAFRNLEAHTSAAGYQVHQSLIAFGSGGPAGVGFGEGRQKFGFLPEPHNDFIFSMIGEEWGLMGATLIVGLYLVIILVGFRIAQRVPDLFGQLLAIGLTSFVALHAVLHMGVGLGLLPPTGLSLPFISYGRSNLLVSLVAIGILMSIARGTNLAEAGSGRRGGLTA
ncbi:MAG: putative peptidoglycan glycosyltransferase FtsW [Gemmatimonadota bacterium]